MRLRRRAARPLPRLLLLLLLLLPPRRRLLLLVPAAAAKRCRAGRLLLRPLRLLLVVRCKEAAWRAHAKGSKGV
jgi:hypothetical protein